jgi:hypothetical protein
MDPESNLQSVPAKYSVCATNVLGIGQAVKKQSEYKIQIKDTVLLFEKEDRTVNSINYTAL